MKYFLLIIIFLVGFSLIAQEVSDPDDDIILLDGDGMPTIPTSVPPIYITDRETISAPKSASKAMIMSALFPGAGQFYVNKKSIWTYVFPAVEIGLWIAAISYDNKGDDLTKQYEAFAEGIDEYGEKRYDEFRQFRVQRNLIEHPSSSSMYGTLEEIQEGKLDYWGNGGFFRLSRSDKQHYYEDIGKYNKYIYGWSDWYREFVRDDGSNNITEIGWLFDEKGIWTGNIVVQSGHPDFGQEKSPFSALRKEYFKIRDEANEAYYTRDRINWAILLNHGLSAYHANRAAVKYNKKISVSPNYGLHYINDNLVPVLGFNAAF